MAVVFMDFFEVTLSNPLTAAATTLALAKADVQRVFDALGMGTSQSSSFTYDPVQGIVAHIPMWIDDGTQRELVRVIRAEPFVSNTITLQRGTPAYAFAAGAKLRCAPVAKHATQGREIVHIGQTASGMSDVVTSSEIFAVPGERSLWSPSTSAPNLTIRLPMSMSWNANSAVFAGDNLPAQIELACRFVARTITFMYASGAYTLQVYTPGGTGGASTLAVPNTARLAVLEISKTAVSLLTADPNDFAGLPRWRVKPEFYA